MRPKVEHSKGLQIEIIGSNTDTRSSKGKKLIYFNKYV